jgi:sugar phosphate isomerase/epimerase
MQLGFMTAILPDVPLADIFTFAADAKFDCLEVMCWPPGGADRRYAGVTHLDVTAFTDADAAKVHELSTRTGVKVSALGYYPNPLDTNPEHRAKVGEHLRAVIAAAAKLKLTTVNTFIGRDHTCGVDENWEQLLKVWPPIVEFAAKHNITLGIEHCPMIFSRDEWPGGKNLTSNPLMLRRLFERFPQNVGLNFDPSHLIWQQIDTPRMVREFGSKIVHVHAKDERINYDRLYEVGVLGMGWHEPKLPGLGDVNWGAFFAALSDTGYAGAVCIEVEDHAYEKTLADRHRSLVQSKRFLQQYMS